MNRPPFIPWLIYKEIRGIFFPWVAFMSAALAAVIWPHEPWTKSVGLPAYFLAGPVLGGLSVGQEFAANTFAPWLMLPVSRRRLLFTKLAVLWPALIAIALVAWQGPFYEAPSWPFRERLTLFLLPVAAGACLAPWLTLLGRSAASGIVVSVVAPVLPAVVTIIAFWAFRAPVAMINREALWMVERVGMVVLSAIGVTQMWVSIRAGEASARQDAAVYLPGWLWRGRGRSASARRDGFSRGLVLIGKELRLHTLSYALTGLYFALLVLDVLWWRSGTLRQLAIGYGCLVAASIGACASAEERRLGVEEWQAMLLPSRATQQVVKLAVVVGLTLVLGIAIPRSLVRLDDTWSRWIFFSGVPTITAIGLYVSSVSSSGVSAVALSVGASALFWIGVPEAIRASATWWRELIGSGAVYVPTAVPAIAHVPEMSYGAFITAVVGASVWLAWRNQRHVDRSLSRVAFQVAGLLACVTAGVLILGAASAVASVAR